MRCKAEWDAYFHKQYNINKKINKIKKEINNNYRLIRFMKKYDISSIPSIRVY